MTTPTPTPTPTTISPLPQLREEVHFESTGQFRRRAEGEVHVLAENLRDVGLRDLHPPRELGLVNAKLLHPAKDAAKERRTDMVYRPHPTITS